MKKRNFARIISFVLVIALALGTLTGCQKGAYNELGELVGVSETQDTQTQTNPSNSNDTNEATTQQDADCSEELAALQAQLDAANKALEEANASIKNLEDSNAALTAELNAEANPFTFDEEGNPVSINLEDAEELLRVEMANGTIAYRIGEGTPIDVIDEIVLTTGKPYAEQTFELAHHKGSTYVIAGVDAEGNVQVLQMVYGSKLYAYNQAWAQPKAGEGFELLETKKMFGNADIALIFADAICVYEDADSEWGYSLCLGTTGEYVAPAKPSAPSAPATQPEQPTDEPSNEEPTDKPSDEDPIDKPSDEDPTDEPEDNEPENNPEPDEDEDNNPGDESTGEPENNPELDETEDVPAGEGPADMQENNPPADMDNGDSDDVPGDMTDSDNTVEDEGPADMQENNPADTTVDCNAPADMATESDNSVVENEGPADMQENSPPAEEVCETVTVTVDVDNGPADCGNTNNSSADNGPADIADGPADM